MARQSQPRRITLGGREAVALTVQEYEQLMASRRQIGGQSARVRVLAQQVKQTEKLLSDLETLVGAPAKPCRAAEPEAGAGAGEDESDGDCLRCEIAALLRRHRDPAR